MTVGSTGAGYSGSPNVGVSSAGPVRNTFTTNYGGSAGGNRGSYGTAYQGGPVGAGVPVNLGSAGVNTSGASFRTSGGSGYGQNYNVQQGIFICDDSYIKSSSGCARSESNGNGSANGGYLSGSANGVHSTIQSNGVRPGLQPRVQPGSGVQLASEIHTDIRRIKASESTDINIPIEAREEERQLVRASMLGTFGIVGISRTGLGYFVRSGSARQ